MAGERGFIDWNPRPETLALVLEIQRIIAEDFANILPVTGRQVFYRLVALGFIGKDEADKISRIIAKARRARLIDFDAISDNGQTLQPLYPEDEAADVVARVKRTLQGDGYYKDRQAAKRAA